MFSPIKFQMHPYTMPNFTILLSPGSRIYSRIKEKAIPTHSDYERNFFSFVQRVLPTGNKLYITTLYLQEILTCRSNRFCVTAVIHERDNSLKRKKRRISQKETENVSLSD